MTRVTIIISLIVGAVLVGGVVRQVEAQDQNAIIEGARLWSDNCMRCHNARSPLERNDQDWKTIVLHMRARANLTKSEAEKIMAYIQQVNIPEVPVSAPQNVPAAEASGNNDSPADASMLRSTPQDGTGKSKESDRGGRRPEGRP